MWGSVNNNSFAKILVIERWHIDQYILQAMKFLQELLYLILMSNKWMNEFNKYVKNEYYDRKSFVKVHVVGWGYIDQCVIQTIKYLQEILNEDLRRITVNSRKKWIVLMKHRVFSRASDNSDDSTEAIKEIIEANFSISYCQFEKFLHSSDGNRFYKLKVNNLLEELSAALGSQFKMLRIVLLINTYDKYTEFKRFLEHFIEGLSMKHKVSIITKPFLPYEILEKRFFDKGSGTKHVFEKLVEHFIRSQMKSVAPKRGTNLYHKELTKNEKQHELKLTTLFLFDDFKVSYIT